MASDPPPAPAGGGSLMVEACFEDIAFAGIPAWIAHLIMPLGFLIIAFSFLLNAIDGICGFS